jgi:cytolysin (calcineurin-like family phosphatase)
MSVVSTVLLTFDLGAEDVNLEDHSSPLVDRVNEWLAARNKGRLNYLGDHFGGHKAPQAEVWGGAFNHLDDDAFTAYVHSLPWNEPRAVLLLINGEYEDGFSVRPPDRGTRNGNPN